MSRQLARIGAELRQLRQHAAFRIPAPVWDAAQQARLEQLITRSPAATPVETAVSGALDDKTLADAATNLWSALGSLDPGEGRPSPEARKAGRYLRNVRQTLEQAGLIVQDHDGEVFHPGLSLEVLVYVDDPALRVETVVETVRPSIYLGKQCIQMGQVIVGRPADQERTVEDKGA